MLMDGHGEDRSCLCIFLKHMIIIHDLFEGDKLDVEDN
jgi:hypothetical protein